MARPILLASGKQARANVQWTEQVRLCRAEPIYQEPFKPVR